MKDVSHQILTQILQCMILKRIKYITNLKILCFYHFSIKNLFLVSSCCFCSLFQTEFLTGLLWNWYHWVTQNFVLIDGCFQNDLCTMGITMGKKSKKVQYLPLTCQIWEHCGMGLHEFARIRRWAAPAALAVQKL